MGRALISRGVYPTQTTDLRIQTSRSGGAGVSLRGMAPATNRSPIPPENRQGSPSSKRLEDPKRTRRALLRWFDANKRELPWRGTRDPWAILVSEIMLQQTTVAAVAPYWEHFLNRWPTPGDLAAASSDEVLSAWAGLGYYRRARLLMESAKRLAKHTPENAAELRSLPGIGEYTAAAVASIAWDEPIAAVDGNVERVVSRLAAFPDDPRKAAGKRYIRSLAQELLATRRPGDFNQALMDLGATICKPRTPDCGHCPIAPTCQAHHAGNPELFPALPPRPTPTPILRVATVITSRGKVLVTERKEAPNKGFLELPMLDINPDPGVDLSEAARSEQLASRLCTHMNSIHDLRIQLGKALPVHRHSITRYRIRILPFRGKLCSGRVRRPLFWAPPGDARPFTTATRRILAANLPSFFSMGSDVT